MGFGCSRLSNKGRMWNCSHLFRLSYTYLYNNAHGNFQSTPRVTQRGRISAPPRQIASAVAEEIDVYDPSIEWSHHLITMKTRESERRRLAGIILSGDYDVEIRYRPRSSKVSMRLCNAVRNPNTSKRSLDNKIARLGRGNGCSRVAAYRRRDHWHNNASVQDKKTVCLPGQEHGHKNSDV